MFTLEIENLSLFRKISDLRMKLFLLCHCANFLCLIVVIIFSQKEMKLFLDSDIILFCKNKTETL